ncbi:MAG TPA: response regulator [Candidatus Acidoferrum sp.]
MIADDEALSGRLLEKTLDRAGYEVIAVENSKQALEQLCKPNGPRLALLDWIMPEVDVALYEAKAAGRDCLRMAQPGAKVEAPHDMVPQAVRRRR